MSSLQVLNISANDEMGARFNGFDLHPLLEERGIYSELGCFWNHTSDKDWVFNIFPGNKRRVQAEVVRGLEVTTGFQSTMQWWSKELLENPRFAKADLVHLQIVHDHFFRLETIAEIVENKPVVWTWHDLWPVTGHCIFPVDCKRWLSGCGSCPDLLSPLPVFSDRTEKEYVRKLEFLKSIEVDVHITTDWMRLQLEPHLRDTGVTLHVFPFGIDLDFFRPADSQDIRQKMGISEQSTCIFARATDDPRKGFKELVSALDLVSKDYDITLLTVQQQGLAEKWSSNLKVVEFPWTNNASQLVSLYQAADLFAMASTGESFGMMALEAMACGKPVVSVARTATAEVVGNPDLEVDKDDLVGSLEKLFRSLLANKEIIPQMGRLARARAENEFSQKKYLDRLTALYASVLEKKKND